MDSSITKDATMEPQAIKSYQQILDNVLAQKLEQNEKRIKAITDYKKGHKKVIEGLEAYPLSLSENCMVPIGKLAFMKGKLTHTNEILIYLGEGYFVKYSASQAIALCNRRIAWADEMLKSLETEKNLYEMRQYIPLEHDVFGKDRKDIVEHWTENKLDEWKVQHRQREKEYRQKLAKLKEKERIDIRTEEDLFKKLDQLEVEEALEDEIYRLETERKAYYDLKDGKVYDESEEDESDSDQITTEKIQEELKKLEDIQMDRATSDTSKDTNTKEKRRISFAEPCVIEDESNTKEISISREVCSALKQDICNESSEDENDTIRIEFSHSSHTPDIVESNNMEIQSPVDIYKMFNAPKSILKRSPNDMIFNEAAPPLNESSSTDTEDEIEHVKHSAYNSVIKEIVQESKTSPVNVSTEKDEKRIVSRFKLERAGRK
ncbi:RNA polymerase II subunit 5-mediating protein like protein [Trachymyrmex zeteki]|uniref:RNA polymerase II subunit 5-mediating protein like protein n=1 Tax=Mycetomoellerius zeteki TaxID=64791 RepID=A0A151X9X2_9HYME|nr:PREDICTED: unconventional prefoldin RPB5 interactor-like protein [Trachymyrmex zeteki]KYQ57176.1 RNA polymerase II subunit 5-mediating protein like protein [Trachymyrmex zeteki]